jgi:hypothetical protein
LLVVYWRLPMSWGTSIFERQWYFTILLSSLCDLFYDSLLHARMFFLGDFSMECLWTNFESIQLFRLQVRNLEQDALSCLLVIYPFIFRLYVLLWCSFSKYLPLDYTLYTCACFYLVFAAGWSSILAPFGFISFCLFQM